MDLTRLAGQFGNLAGNLLFRGRPEIDPGYNQIDREQYEPDYKIEDFLGNGDFDLNKILIEGLIGQAKKKKKDGVITLPEETNPELDKGGIPSLNPYGSGDCAECRARQAKSGMMNIMDPCRGVCGG